MPRDRLFRLFGSLAWAGPMLLAPSLIHCSNSSGYGTGDNGDAGETSGNNEPGNSNANDGGANADSTAPTYATKCEQYLACVGLTEPRELAVALAAYGPNGSCAGASGDLRERCESACETLRQDLRDDHPNARECLDPGQLPSLLPLNTMFAWTYRDKAQGSSCNAFMQSSSALPKGVVPLHSTCGSRQLSTLLRAAKGGTIESKPYEETSEAAWRPYLEEPAEEGHTWESDVLDYDGPVPPDPAPRPLVEATWTRAESVKTPLGEFTDCWTKVYKQEEGGNVFETYCRGVGMVRRQFDVRGRHFDFELTEKNF